MKLRSKLLLLCVLLSACGMAACVVFAVSYAWRSAAEHEAASLCTALAKTGYAMESELSSAQTGASPGAGRLIRAFYLATGGRPGFVLMSGDEYLANNTGLALGELIPRMKPAASDAVLPWGAFRMDGRSMLVTVWHSSSLPVTILAARSLDRIDADTTALAWRCILFSSTVLLIIWLLAVQFIRHTLRPLAQLEAAAGSIAAGDYSRRPQIRGSDEVTAVAAAFCRMASAVEENVQALKDRTDRQRQFIGDMGHEMKTPLTAILLNTETLLTRALPEDVRRACTERIRSQAKWMEKLAQQLLSIVLLDSPPAPTGVTSRELAEDLRSSLQETLRASGLTLCIEADDSGFPADPALMRSAVVNLVTNAARASTPGDSIQVDVLAGRITVRDTGAGMPPEVLARACEPFYTADSSRSKRRSGAGLGLSLVRRICEVYGGRLLLESTPGQGTTATIMFPAVRRADGTSENDDILLTVCEPQADSSSLEWAHRKEKGASRK